MKNKAAQALGKLGGQVKSKAKAKASKENGKLGGRTPKTVKWAQEAIYWKQKWLRDNPRQVQSESKLAYSTKREIELLLELLEFMGAKPYAPYYKETESTQTDNSDG